MRMWISVVPLYDRTVLGKTNIGKVTVPGLSGKKMTYTDPYGRSSTYYNDQIPMYRNLEQGGQELYEKPFTGFMAGYTGRPDYAQNYNNYWAGIPDEDWNKVYYPATADARQNYKWRNPDVLEEYNPSTGNWYNKRGGYIHIPHTLEDSRARWSGKDELKASTFTLGTPVMLTSAAWEQYPQGDWLTSMDGYNLATSGDGYVPMGRVKAHEGTHANQILANNADRRAEDAEPTGPNIRTGRGQALGPGIYRPIEIETGGYTGDNAEEVQMMRAFKDAVDTVKRDYTANPGMYAQLNEDERKFIESANAYPRSAEEMRSLMQGFRSRPHLAMYLGWEATRALDTADDWERQQYYFPAYLKEDDRERYRKLLQDRVQAFYDNYFARNGQPNRGYMHG